MTTNEVQTIPFPVAPQPRRPAERLYGFDALRAFAAILVVMLHAAHPYIPHQMPGLLWPAHDNHPSAIVDGLFWWIEGFIMPLFLFMSGYFAFGLLQRMTLPEFFQHRYRRILLPLVFSVLIILPLDFYAWGFGLVMDGRASWRKLRSLKFDEEISQNLWGLSHLWYLQYLFLYSLLLAGGWTLWKRLTHNATDTTRSIFTRLGLASLPIASAIVLVFEPEVVIGFQHSVFPVPAKFAYSGLFFIGGAMLCCFPHFIEKMKRTAILMLAVSIPLAAMMIQLTHDRFQAGFDANAGRLYAATTTMFAWMTVAGLSGLFLRIKGSLPTSVQSIGAASFWIYLFHHPIVGLVQVILGQTTLPSIVKFSIVTVTTTFVCLVSYKYCVQNTWVGRLLTGRDLRRQELIRPSDADPRKTPRIAS